MKENLLQLVGQVVNVVAGDDCSDTNGIYLNLIGKLEAPTDDDKRFYLRCRDGAWGTEGGGFHPGQVEKIEKRPSGMMQSILKKHLTADHD